MSVELIAERVGLDYARDGNATVAIQDFSLRMTESEFITVVGPSGCGKSSFLNLVAGFLQPTRGKLLLEGASIRGPGADRGVVFQEHALFPWMTVERNIGYGHARQRRRARGNPAHRQRVAGDDRVAAVRERLSQGTLRRHEAARRHRARARHAAEDAPDGRAVCGAGCADAPLPAGGTGSFIPGKEGKKRIDSVYAAVFARDDWVAKNPKTVEATLRALKNGAEWLEANRDAAAEIVAKDINIPKPIVLGTFDKIFNQVHMSSEWANEFTEKSTYLHGLKELKTAPTAKDVIDVRPLKAVCAACVKGM